MAGLLDALFSGSQGGGLLDFLQSLQPQQNSFSGLPSDQAQYGAQSAQPTQAMAQMQPRQPPPMQQTPQPQMQPAPQAPMQATPQQPQAGDSYMDRINSGGSLIGSLFGSAPTNNQANLTAAYLRSIGAPEEAIASAVGNGRVAGNGEVLKTLLTKYANQEKIRPMNAAERQSYGVPENTPASIDTTTGKPQYGPANTTVSNVINGEKEQDKVVGKGYGERQMEIQKAGYNAPGAIGNLNLMEKLIEDPSFYSGQGGQTATTLKRLAVSLGIAGAETAAPNELFQKLSQKTVLDAAGGSLGNNFSNGDRDFISGTVANIDNTKDGNKQIIEVSRQVQKRNIEIAKQAREYAKAHNGRLDAGFEEQVAAYAEKNPLFANIGLAPNAQPDLSKAQKAPDGNTYVPDPARPGKYLKLVQ